MSDPFDAPAQRGSTPDIDENGIRRNQWGQPVIEGTNYVRATTMAKTLADTYNLNRWQLRKLAHGLTIGSDELLKLASVTDPDGPGAKKTYESQIIEPALDRAGANAGAKSGTSLHLATHRFDAGASLDTFPDWAKKSLSMYRHQMWSKRIDILQGPMHIEVFTACDEVGAAGTADRILSHITWGEKFRVGDLKTQKDHPREFNALEIAVQLAIYAHGLNTRGIWRVDGMSTGAGHWDTSTVGRMDLEHAVVMWLPVAGEHAGKCELVDIDIAWGWTIARMSERVRAERKAARSKATTLRFDTPATLPGAATPMTQDDKIDAAFSEPTESYRPMTAIEAVRLAVEPLVFDDETQLRGIAYRVSEPVTHYGTDPSFGGMTHKGRIEDCPAPDHAGVDYAGKMCPDGRVHGMHDGCPGRKKRSPAQIKRDAGCLCETTETRGGTMYGAFHPDCPIEEHSTQAVATFNDEMTAHRDRVQGPSTTDALSRLAEMSQPVSGPGIDAALAAGEARREALYDRRTFEVHLERDFVDSLHMPCGASNRSGHEDDAADWRADHTCDPARLEIISGIRDTPAYAEAAAMSSTPAVANAPANQDTAQDIGLPSAPNAKTPTQLAGEAEQVFAGLREQRAPVDPVIALRAKIKALKTKEEMSLLWQEHQPIWTEDLTKLGLATLSGVTS